MENHSSSVVIIKGYYKGNIGEVKNISNNKYIIQMDFKTTSFDFESLFFNDIRYESGDKKGYIQIISIEKDVLNGMFMNDDGNAPIEKIVLNMEDKNIKKNYVNKYFKLNDDVDIFIAEPEAEYMNSYDDFNHMGVDESNLSASDKVLYNNIKSTLDVLCINEKCINFYTVINHYNFIISCCSKKLKNVGLGKMDSDIILNHIIIFELVKNVNIDIYSLYSNYANTKQGIKSYFNMLRDKDTKFSVVNCFKYFGVSFMKSYVTKTHDKDEIMLLTMNEVLFNTFMYIKSKIAIYRDIVMPNVSNKIDLIPIGKHNKNIYVQTEYSSVKYDSIKDLNEKIIIAQENNEVDLVKRLKNQILKEEGKKSKNSFTTKKILKCNTILDCFDKVMTTLNTKLNAAKKENHFEKIILYKFVIENFLNMEVLDDITLNKYREIFKNEYLVIYTNNLLKEKHEKIKNYNNWHIKYFNDDLSVNMDEFYKHFQACLNDIKLQIDIKKQNNDFDKIRMNLQEDNNLLRQMKGIKLNGEKTFDNDNYIDNDVMKCDDMFGDVSDLFVEE